MRSSPSSEVRSSDPAAALAICVAMRRKAVGVHADLAGQVAAGEAIEAHGVGVRPRVVGVESRASRTSSASSRSSEAMSSGCSQDSPISTPSIRSKPVSPGSDM